jgi:hypothetical protein
MTVPGLNSWLAAAFLALALYVIFSREPEFIMPEPRQMPWTTLLRRVGSIRAMWRRDPGIWSGNDEDPEGQTFIQYLKGEPEPADYPPVVTVGLPYLQPVPRTSLVTEQQPPWADAPAPSRLPLLPPPLPRPVAITGPHAWQFGDPGDPPTLVRGMRAIMDDDPDGVRRYVDSLPRYED